MRPLIQRYQADADRAIALRRSGQEAAANQVLLADLDPTWVQLETQADAFVNLQFSLSATARAELARVQAAATGGVAGVALLALLLGVVLSYRAARSVTNPVRALVLASDRIAAGDYPTAIELAQAVSGPTPNPEDEVKHLAGRLGLAARDLLARERRLTAHAGLSSALASTIDVRQLSETALRALAAHVVAETAAVYRFEPEARMLVREGAFSPSEGLPGAASFTDSVIGEADCRLPYRLGAERPGRFSHSVGRAERIATASLGCRRSHARPGRAGRSDLRRRNRGTGRRRHRLLGAGSESVRGKSPERLGSPADSGSERRIADPKRRDSGSGRGDSGPERRRLHAQNEELEDQRNLAEKAVRARDEFISNAAHELKTPITSLKGTAQLLILRARRTAGQLDAESVVKSARQIDEQSKRLARLVEQLLNLSRLETGKFVLNKEEQDVAALVRDLVKSIRQSYPERAIEVRGGCTITIRVELAATGAGRHESRRQRDQVLARRRSG